MVTTESASAFGNRESRPRICPQRIDAKTTNRDDCTTTHYRSISISSKDDTCVAVAVSTIVIQFPVSLTDHNRITQTICVIAKAPIGICEKCALMLLSSNI